jgi:succinoglycan biosynthesis transport protein ExoP
LAASFLLNLTTLPVYQARTSIDVQTLNGDFMNIRSAAPTSDPGASSDSFVQTQIKLLQSETLLEHTAARLEAEPHPAFVERKDLLSRVERTLHFSRRSNRSG